CDPATNAAAFAAWLASFSGSDTCGTATVTHNSAGLSDLCGGTGTETVTFTLTDECGNKITKDATFTIVDTTAPSIDTAGSDLILACDDGIGIGDSNADSIAAWLADNGGANASDLCGSVSWSNDFTTINDDCGAGGSVTITFTATDDCDNPTSFTQDILVASINIVKTFTDDSVIAGGNGSYFTLVVTNDGTAPLSNVDIFDDVDDRLTVTGVSGTAGSDADSDGDDQTVEWSISSLAVGASETITVYFEVASDVEEADGVGGRLNLLPNVPNDATVDAIATDDNTISVNDDSSDSIDIKVDIDLDIVKTFDPTHVPQGTFQTFTIVVSNTGPSDAVDVSVTDFVNSSLDITSINVTPNGTGSGSGNCSVSDTIEDDQEMDCTVQIPTGESVTITVEYLVAPFIQDGVSPYGTDTAGDDFYFVFLNGSVLEGSTATGKVYLNGDDISGDVTIITSLTRNDIIFDPPGPDPAFELHLSCSDPFTGGWGQSGGPVQGVDTNWQIAYFSIGRYSPQGFLKSCGNVTNDFDILNIADTSGEDSFETETATDDATVTIGPGITLDRLQTNGKRLTARLNNLTGENKTIDEVYVVWPESNGNLIKVWLTFGKTNDLIWQGNDDPAEALLDVTDTGWIGATLLTGEAILRFDFSNKVVSSGYTIRVHFTDGTWLDINVPDESGTTVTATSTSKLSIETTMSIYPNPVQTSFNVKLEGYNGEYADIAMYDTSGRQIMKVKKPFVPNQDLTIDLPLKIDEGMYYVRLMNDYTVKAVPIVVSK
ncbi:T9SS type A sorting domain-containing protein, partial [Gaetbulibacter aquiaggeris]